MRSPSWIIRSALRIFGDRIGCGKPEGAAALRYAGPTRRGPFRQGCQLGNFRCPYLGSIHRPVTAAKEWLAAREADLLPVPYYHVVFTLPAAIADIAYQNKAVLYDLLFKVSAETMLTIAADPKHLGARIGITSVLHTWGSALTHHPHVHMIVPGGGISLDGQRWMSCRPGFFLPVRVLSRLFRRLFLEKLVAAHQAGRLSFFGDHVHLADAQSFAAYLAPLRKAEWVVYAKRPFGGPEAVLAYLSRYTHRVAIANSRLIAFDEQRRHLQVEGLPHRGPRSIQAA